MGAVVWCSFEAGVTSQSGINSAYGSESLLQSCTAPIKGDSLSEPGRGIGEV
jgi:hypothetical protein